MGSRDSSGIDRAIKNRYAYYFEVAPKLFIENPIFGVGIGGFSKYNPIREQNAHNTYLEILTGMGMVGFIPFIMILFLSWKELRAVQNTSKRIKALSVLNSYSTALELGFLSLLVAGLFISLDFSKILWLAVTLTTVMANIRRNYIISERP